jgi:hypothetical protein
MSKPQAAPGAAQAMVEMRRARVVVAVGARNGTPSVEPASTPPERLAFFLREVEELYWNELAWEQMTDEEAVSGGRFTELVFPGFLTLVDGLLPCCTPEPDQTAPRAYPDAVEEILTFLGERCATLTAALESGADSQKVVWARAMSLHLLDLVLYRLYRLSPAEREMVEAFG